MLGLPCCIKLEDERLVKVTSEEVLEAGSTLRRRDIALSGTELAACTSAESEAAPLALDGAVDALRRQIAYKTKLSVAIIISL